ELVDTVAATEHVLAYSKRFRHFDDVGADVFDLLAVFRFDRDEAVCDQAPEIERDLGPIFVTRCDRTTHLGDPIRPAWFLQCGKKFARSWNADVVGANRVRELILRQATWFCADHGTTSQ